MTDRPIYRILDVSLNRAREALRVIEDYVRFPHACERSSASPLLKRIKSLRHRVGEISATLQGKLVASRDVGGDRGRYLDEVGKSVKPVRVIATANIKRAQEALRSIEEYAKSFDPKLSNKAGRMRFDAYRLEKELASLDLRDRLRSSSLYVLLTTSIASCDIVTAARAAIDGGADILQLREQDMNDADFVRRARAISETCRSSGRLFIVNNRVDIALASSADGVHLGRGDMPLTDARRILGEGKIIGATTHDLAEAKRAIALGADYLSAGPMFPTMTKPGLAAGGFSYLKSLLRLSDLPVFCIGGIDRDNVRSVARSGGRRIAVCSSVIGERDIRGATRRLKRELKMATKGNAI